MRELGPEDPEDAALRAWFGEQERKNVERLDEGARLITQLVTALYGILFAVLALGDEPSYLDRISVQVLAMVSIGLFFVALVGALVTLYPRHTSYHQDNLSEQERIYKGLLSRKAWGLRVALWGFLLGSGVLGVAIAAVLFKF